jgi:hypothetical protein
MCLGIILHTSPVAIASAPADTFQIFTSLPQIMAKRQELSSLQQHARETEAGEDVEQEAFQHRVGGLALVDARRAVSEEQENTCMLTI